MACHSDFKSNMKRAVFVLLILAAGCNMEQDQSLTGSFLGTQKFGIGQVSSSIVLHLSQHGSLLTGEVTPPFQTGGVAITGGMISGSSFRWDLKSNGATYR